MGLKNLKLMKPTDRAKVIKCSQTIIQMVEAEFGGVVNKQELKHIPSFICFVCCLVEEAYSGNNKEKKKVNKKDEVLKTIIDFIKTPLTEQDKKGIFEIIEDLHTSGRIKKYSYLSTLFFNFWGYS